MLGERLRELASVDSEATCAAFAKACRNAPIALVPGAANLQHYEVPPAFFERVLGPRLEYSCALWEEGVSSLVAAEERMLEVTARRAGVEDGMEILDLGCGWGSFSVFAGERFPRARILAVSNSEAQRHFIEARVRRQGLEGIRVVTQDVNRFHPEGRFDRVVSVEMFEHVRNHGALLERIASWLAPGGRAFVHHFAHRTHAYPYEDRGPGDWMAREFFSGGMMPSEDWLERFPGDLGVVERIRIPGTHYARTCEAWLGRLDADRERLAALLAEGAPRAEAARTLERWRLFFLACAELFAFRGGSEWGVVHVVLAPTRSVHPETA